jgi:tetratricopeptide (TPR) repeat protein
MGNKRWVLAAAAGILLLGNGPLLGQQPGFENWERGKSYYDKGNFANAAEEFIRALEADPAFAKYQELVGEVLVEKTREYDRAIKLLGKSLEKGESPKALFWLGKAYYKRGLSGGEESRTRDFAKALEYLQRADRTGEEPKAEELLTEIKSFSRPQGGDNLIWKLVALLGITVISVGAVVALRRFAFPQSSALVDIILFLVLVVVVVLSTALLRIISGQQFESIINRMLDIVRAILPAGS